MKLTAVVPAYNEERRIAPCIEDSIDYFNGHAEIDDFELVIASEPCSDDTLEIVRDFQEEHDEITLLVNDVKQGKGYSVRRGVLEGEHDNVLFYDVDLAVPLGEFDTFLPHVGEYDIVLGSRLVEGAEVDRNVIRKFLSYGFFAYRNIVLGMRVVDTQCGFKFFNREACRDVFESLETKDQFFDVELLYRAESAGLDVKEVPVEWIEDRETKFDVKKVIPKFFRKVIELRLGI